MPVFVTQMNLPKLGRRLNLLVACGYGLISYYGNSIGLEKAIQKVAQTENDESVPVPSKIRNLINNVLNDMKLKEEVKSNIKPFLLKTIDLKRFGCPNESAGAYLGVPQYYLFNERSDVKFSTVVVKNKTLTAVPTTDYLRNAVLLSDEAKKFGIAREIYESLNENVKVTAALPLIVILSFNFLSYLLEKFRSGKPFKRIHYTPHVSIFIVAAFMYALVFDIRTCYIETLSDFQASELGQSYLQGGIEYYEKMIQRNKNIKSLNKNAPISENGDINVSKFRTYHMPLLRRVIYLKDLKEGKLEKPTPWTYVFY